jgi:DNA adenine methylase
MSSDVINLKGVLEKRGITLYQLCQDTGLSYQQGFAIANNKTKKIEFQTLESLCNYLDCELSELLNIKPKSDKSLKSLVLKFPTTENSKRESVKSLDKNPKPFLQWVGGKRSLISQYQDFFPKKINKYYEPFLGGGAVFFHLNPNNSILNDSNIELIETYKAIRDNPKEVIELLKMLKERHSLDLYTNIRNLDRDTERFSKFTSTEIASRLIYLNQTCFNGVYRVNKHGQFNVPIGSSLNRLICDEDSIFNASKILKKVKLYSIDFEKVIEKAGKDDFVYFDPPYFPISQYSDFTRYTKDKFYTKDQERLKDVFDKLDKKGCKVMLSNSDCDYIRNLYKGYNIHVVYSGRTLNSDKNKRGKVSELVITNY